MTATATTPAVATRRNPFAAIGKDISAATNVDEALALSGLNWGITEYPTDNFTIWTPDGLVNTGLANRRLIVRDDTHKGLGVVGGIYQTATNRDWFAVADHVYNLGGRFAYAGERDGGGRTFLTMTLPDATVEVLGKDLVTFGLTFRAAHDGRNNNMVNVDGRRLACMNGMTIKIKGVAHEWKIRHTASGVQQIEDAQKYVNGMLQYARSFAAVAQQLVDTSMTRQEFIAFIDSLYPRPDADASKSKQTMWENRRSDLLSLWAFADTNDFGRDSAWAAFNAVTEYADWGQTVAARAGQSRELARPTRQADNAQMGLRNRALELLTV